MLWTANGTHSAILGDLFQLDTRDKVPFANSDLIVRLEIIRLSYVCCG